MKHQRRRWSNRDKRTANRNGIGMLDKPSYRGESYGQRMSFGAFRPEDRWYDSMTPYEFVETVRGRRVAPPGPRARDIEAEIAALDADAPDVAETEREEGAETANE